MLFAFCPASCTIMLYSKNPLNRTSTGPDKMSGLERIPVYRGFPYLPIHVYVCIDNIGAKSTLPTIVYIQQLFLFTSRGHTMYIVCFVCN